MLRLPLRRGRRRARPARDARDAARRDDAPPAHAAGEGITGTAAAERRPVAIAANADLDPRWKEFPNLPESEYESILAVPILAREQLAGALNVRTREPREFRPDEIELLQAIASQVAQSIVHAQLYAEAQRRVAELEALARISEAVSESLYLEESLEAIVKTTMDAVQATGAALVLEDGRIAWPEGQRRRLRRPHAAALEAARDRPARGRPRHAVHRRGARAARGDRPPRRRRARARPRGHARRPRPGDPPPRQEQPPDRRLAPAPAGARRGRRPARGARALRQPDPRHRRRARVAHRAAGGGRRPRGADRPPARDARAGNRRRTRRRGASSSRSRSRAPARPRSRSSSPSCCRTRSSTAPARCGSSWRTATATSCSRSPTKEPAPTARRAARGSRSSARSSPTSCRAASRFAGARAEVVFPA